VANDDWLTNRMSKPGGDAAPPPKPPPPKPPPREVAFEEPERVYR
jgi:hypothetical protein